LHSLFSVHSKRLSLIRLLFKSFTNRFRENIIGTCALQYTGIVHILYVILTVANSLADWPPHTTTVQDKRLYFKNKKIGDNTFRALSTLSNVSSRAHYVVLGKPQIVSIYFRLPPAFGKRCEISKTITDVISVVQSDT